MGIQPNYLFPSAYDGYGQRGGEQLKKRRMKIRFRKPSSLRNPHIQKKRSVKKSLKLTWKQKKKAIRKRRQRMRVKKYPVSGKKRNTDAKGFEEVQPTELYRTTQEWAEQSRHNGTDPFMLEVYTGCEFQLSASKGMDKPLFTECVKTPPPAYISVIPGGRVWGEEGSVITPDNRLLWDVSLQILPVDQHPVFTHWHPTSPNNTSETVAVLSFFSSRTYFHWLYDVLARLQLIRMSGISVDKYLISQNALLAYQEETLTMLGIPPEKILLTGPDFHLKAEKLVISSIPMYSFLEYGRWPFDFIRRELFEGRNIGRSGYDRIYISRSKATTRKIINEDQVMQLLSAYGYNLVVLEEHSVIEQIEIFASAHSIIAAHGSGLANLSFCSPGTQVIEIFARNYTPECYWLISNYLQLDYYSMVQDGCAQLEHENFCDQNIIVRLDELRNILDLAGITRRN